MAISRFYHLHPNGALVKQRFPLQVLAGFTGSLLLLAACGSNKSTDTSQNPTTDPTADPSADQSVDQSVDFSGAVLWRKSGHYDF